MKYVFIENHRAEFSIKAMCRVLRVARSGWYVWSLRHHQPNRRQQFRLVCDAAVRQSFNDAKQRYGAPRLADELPEYNIKTIAASLHRQGLRAKAARKFRPVSHREHSQKLGTKIGQGRLPYSASKEGVEQAKMTIKETLENVTQVSPVIPSSSVRGEYDLIHVYSSKTNSTVSLRVLPNGKHEFDTLIPEKSSKF